MVRDGGVGVVFQLSRPSFILGIQYFSVSDHTQRAI